MPSDNPRTLQFNASFYKAAAICSALSAVTTLLLIFLPRFFIPVDTFDERMARVHEPAYVLRSWAYLVHPFLVLMAALAIAMRIRRTASAAAIIGLLGFCLWGFTEAGQQTLTLFAFDEWRAAYATADEATRAIIRANTVMYDGLWDAMYVLLLIGFSIGNLSLGLALLRGRRLTRVTGFFLLAAVVLTLGYLIPELGGPELPESLTAIAYPAIQPLGRLIIGLWLWRAADESKALPD
jgi:hypothetical protein